MDKEKNYLIFVGLGNPGKRYELTRHNMGYLVLRALAGELGATLRKEKRFFAETARVKIEGVAVHLLLPVTYMNDSGKAVRSYLDYYNLDPGMTVVVVDDVGLPFGKLRLRKKGSCGGHNGLLSIERAIGSADYPRLRIGIGKDRVEGDNLSDYVLGSFTDGELNEIPEILERAKKALLLLLKESIDSVMNKINIGDKVKKVEDKIDG